MNQNLRLNENPVLYRKNFPEKFKEVFAKALSYFPELKDVYVFMLETRFYGVQHTLRSYPPLILLHWPKKKWKYPIVINKNRNINIPFYDLTFDQQVGLLVHELSHISYYARLSRSQTVSFGFMYFLNKKYVRKIENETDIRAIKQGAGISLFECRLELFEHRIRSPYCETEDTYMSPDDIIKNLKSFPDLYSSEVLEKCEHKLQSVKDAKRTISAFCKIPVSRLLKHSLKTCLGFFPAIIEMIYAVLIKKTV